MPGFRFFFPLRPHHTPVVEFDAPDGYPVESIKTPNALIYLEGRVYGDGRVSLMQRVLDLETEARDDATLASRLRACADSGDGDFAIVRLGRADGRLGVVGDRFARLPVYYHVSHDRVVVSRDQDFVLAQVLEPAVDRTALAQLLLFGYPLRSRTLTDGIHRLLPGDVLLVSSRGCNAFPPPRSPFRRDPRAQPAASASALRDAFVAACRDRHLDAHDHVLSLSGGIDSRTAGAGMRAAFGKFSAVTFFAPGSSHADERDVAAGVARALGVEWRAYQLDYTDSVCIDGIVRSKLGLNPVDVAFGLDYVRRLRSDYAQPVALWTGEGADKLLCEHRAIPRRPTIDRLARFVVEKNAILDPARVRALTGVHEDELLDSIRTALLAAGDIEPDDAYVHFLLAERVVRWHVEGEDRHRAAVWPIAPFFAREFFDLARAIPGPHKRGRRVYRAFLTALAPDVAVLPLAGGHAAPASLRFALEYSLRERLRNQRVVSSAYARIRRRGGAGQSHGDVWRERLSALHAERAVPSSFDAAAIDEVASGRAAVSSNALAVLLTAVLAVRRIQC